MANDRSDGFTVFEKVRLAVFAVAIVATIVWVLARRAERHDLLRPRTSSGATRDTDAETGGTALQVPTPQSEALHSPITRDEVTLADLALHPAKYWEKIGDRTLRCLLCPRGCVLRHTERGKCQARANFDGALYSLVYARTLTLNADPIEKKPIFHMLPGTRILSIATAGCNLRCVFCQNWSISQAKPEEVAGRHMHVLPERVVEIAQASGCPSIAFTYTEPSIFYEYMFDTAKAARAAGIRTVWVTCGYINERPLRDLAPYLDAANVDLKGFSEEFYRKYCGASLAPVLRTLEILRAEKVYFEITNLVIPGANDDPELIRAMCEWIVKTLGKDVPLHFSRFHPDHKLRNVPATPAATLETARRIAKTAGLEYVYIGNISVAGAEDTACPKCGAVLLRRFRYTIMENRMKNGGCPECGTTLPGVFAPAGE